MSVATLVSMASEPAKPSDRCRSGYCSGSKKPRIHGTALGAIGASVNPLGPSLTPNLAQNGLQNGPQNSLSNSFSNSFSNTFSNTFSNAYSNNSSNNSNSFPSTFSNNEELRLFSRNVDCLCSRFPDASRDLIVSLLESTCNDSVQASCLIEELAKNSKELSRKRRHRDWGDMDYDLSRVSKRAMHHNSETAAAAAGGGSDLLLFFDEPAHPEIIDSSASCSGGNSRDDENSGSSARQDENSASRASRNNSQMLLPFPPRTDLTQENNPLQLLPPVLRTVSEPKQVIRILSRMVLIQNDKINHLQSQNLTLSDENDKLRTDIKSADVVIQQYKSMNSTLQYYVAKTSVEKDPMYFGQQNVMPHIF